jgi:hypothetical protein
MLWSGTSEVWAQKVLVNIWDGTEWRVISQLYTDLPSLSAIGPLVPLTANEDCFRSLCGCMRTDTRTQHATMLTGVLADEHGVFANFPPSCSALIPAGLTVFEQLETSDPALRTAFISSKPLILGRPTFGNIEGVVDQFLVRGMASSGAADEAITLVENWQDQDFFIVVHFPTPDVVGHQSGVDSPEYADALLENDRQLGRLLGALREDVRAQTTVYILGDHGFGCPDAQSHGCSPETFIVSNNPTLSPLSMVEVAGWLRAHFELP